MITVSFVTAVYLHRIFICLKDYLIKIVIDIRKKLMYNNIMLMQSR